MSSEPSRTVLVTGATGFIGLNILHTLATSRLAVIGTANGLLPQLAADSLERLGPLPTMEQADIRDVDAVNKICARYRPDIVIHTAAVTAGVDRERSDGHAIVDVNLGGTQAVLDACRTNGVRRLVHLSSGAVYGSATFGTQTLDETTCVEPTGLYGITKFAAEQLVRRHGELHNTEVVIGRLSAAFGPWEYPIGVRDFMSPMLQLVGAAQRGETARYAKDAPRNWVYAPDAARALVSLALDPILGFGCYNVCPEQCGTVSELIDRLRSFTTSASFVGVDDLVQATLSYDADPRLNRAPVSARRINDKLGSGFWSTHTDAFDDYLSWVGSNPGWL